jgi:ferredoxin
MPKYKVIYDREACIGSFACSAAAHDFWLYNEDNKATLKDATFNSETKRWELVIEESDYDDNQAAAEVCPVFAIKIEKIAEDSMLEPENQGDWKSE